MSNPLVKRLLTTVGGGGEVLPFPLTCIGSLVTAVAYGTVGEDGCPFQS